MATSKNNVVTHGLSGKVGDLLVFSQRKGKTIVSRVPRRSGIFTAGQVAQQEKFAMAANYAKAAVQDPILKPGYEAKAEADGLTSYNVAVADYLNAPEIHSVITSGYTGTIGNNILIRATDDFEVESVIVRIEKADGTIIEEGNAVIKPFHWEYSATVANPSIAGCKIIITAFDIPQNETTKTIAL